MSCTNHPDYPGPLVRCVKCLQCFCRDCVSRDRQFFFCLECRPAAVPRAQRPSRTEALDPESEPVAPSPPPPAGVRAGLGARAMAFAIDSVIVGTALVILNSLLAESKPGLVLLATLVVPVAYEVLFVLQTGQTPGKSALDIRVVSAAGGPAGDGQALARGLFKVAQFGCCALSFFFAPLTDDRRGIHDYAAGTRVIRAESPGHRAGAS